MVEITYIIFSSWETKPNNWFVLRRSKKLNVKHPLNNSGPICVKVRKNFSVKVQPKFSPNNSSKVDEWNKWTETCMLQ